MALTIHAPFTALLWGFDGALNGGKDDAPAPSGRVQAIVDKAKKRGFRQAAIVNADAARAAALREHLDSFPGIEALHASCELGAEMPDVAALTAAAKAMDTDPTGILLIHPDSATVNAGAGAGFRTFRFTRLSLDALDSRLPRSSG